MPSPFVVLRWRWNLTVYAFPSVFTLLERRFEHQEENVVDSGLWREIAE
jgi:hypothetical protein